MSICLSKHGIVGVTVAYGILLFFLRILAPKCLDKPCESEGVDNTVISWGTDFFVATALFLFAYHLLVFPRTAKDGTPRKSGILAQILMSGNFWFLGLNHWFYANNGVNDAKGLPAYWLISLVASFLFTSSGLCHAQLAREIASEISSSLRVICGLAFISKVFQTCLVLSCFAHMAGCVWCIIHTDIHVAQVIDAFDDTDDQPFSIKLVVLSEVALYFSYALLWIPVGILLHSGAHKRPSIVLGLPTPTAALSIMLLQWTIGAMYFVSFTFGTYMRGGDFVELYDKSWGTQFFHYGMLLAFFFSHNLSWTSLAIPVPEDEKKESADTNESSGDVFRNPTGSTSPITIKSVKKNKEKETKKSITNDDEISAVADVAVAATMVVMSGDVVMSGEQETGTEKIEIMSVDEELGGESIEVMSVATTESIEVVSLVEELGQESIEVVPVDPKSMLESIEVDSVDEELGLESIEDEPADIELGQSVEEAPEPESTEVKPAEEAPEPESTEVKPAEEAPEPESAEVEPVEEAPEPESTEVKPVEEAPVPESTEVEPAEEVPAPESTEVKSAEEVPEPESTEVKSVEEATEQEPAAV